MCIRTWIKTVECWGWHNLYPNSRKLNLWINHSMNKYKRLININRGTINPNHCKGNSLNIKIVYLNKYLTNKCNKNYNRLPKMRTTLEITSSYHRIWVLQLRNMLNRLISFTLDLKLKINMRYSMIKVKLRR